MIPRSRLLFLAVSFTFSALCLLAGIAYASEAVTTSVDPIDLLGDAFHEARRWSTVGTLASLVALCNLLMAALVRTGLGDWLDERGWLPAAAGLIGGIAGVVGAASTHGSVATGFVEGVVAGKAAVGLNQHLRQRARAKVSAAPEAHTHVIKTGGA